MPKPGEVPLGLSTEFGRDKVVIYERVRYQTDILPLSHHDLKRHVELKGNSQVEGHIYGRKVELGIECVVDGYIFGEEWVTIGLRSLVTRGVLSHGAVVLEEGTQIGEKVPGSLIAADIKMGKRCNIVGNIIATRSLEIGDGCAITGVACCIDGPIKVGEGVSMRDVMCSGKMTIKPEANIMDDVIWSRTGLAADSVELDGSRPGRDDLVNWNGQEMNLNLKRLETNKVDQIAVGADHRKVVHDILTHKRRSD